MADVVSCTAYIKTFLPSFLALERQDENIKIMLYLNEVLLFQESSKEPVFHREE